MKRKVSFIIKQITLKSFSVDSKDYSDLATPQEGYVKPNFIEADSLQTLLQNMKHRWVQINRGPEAVEGLLSDCFDDHLLITVNNEIISVFTYHIKSISYKNENQSAEQEKQNSPDKQNNQDKSTNQNTQVSNDEQAKGKNKDKEKQSSSDKQNNQDKSTKQDAQGNTDKQTKGKNKDKDNQSKSDKQKEKKKD